MDATAILGDGPSWDSARGALLWVDILQGRIHSFNPLTGEDSYKEIAKFVGTEVPDGHGSLMQVAQHGFYRFDPESGNLEAVADPEAQLRDNRFNDGKFDVEGRFWAGMMELVEIQLSVRCTACTAISP